MMAVIGILGAAALTMSISDTKADNKYDGMVRGSVPTAQIELKAGHKQICLEGHLCKCGQYTCSCPGMLRSKVAITGPTGPVEVDSSPRKRVYKPKGGDAVQLADVNIPSDGLYAIKTSTPAKDVFGVAVGNHVPGDSTFWPITFTVILALIGLLGLRWTILGIKLRRRGTGVEAPWPFDPAG